MRILIVGNDPAEIGGVSNYTRPLSLKFAALGHDVFYFFSGAWHKRYNWLLRPYLRIDRKRFPFETAELINSPNWALHQGDPLLDISSARTEYLFRKYLEQTKPDVCHVHSRLALPLSIIEIASTMGIPVFNTIHVYGLICPRRVMVDAEGRPCSGPVDLAKCTACITPVNIRRMKFIVRIENTWPELPAALARMKKNLLRPAKKIPVSPGENSGRNATPKKGIEDRLLRRHEYALRLMNHHVVMNVCVSSDVKRTMARFGVIENKLLVQPIGSILAASQKRDMHALHTPLVIGNIGGVGYYKGTHVLVDAIDRVRGGPFVVKIFGKYDRIYVTQIMKGNERLPIQFMGAYQPEDIPGILDQVDVVVLPSICNDTAPQTIFESYSARIPIVASNTGGFPDFVAHGVNGYLFKTGDSQALADALTDVLAHPGRIVEFSKQIPSLKTIPENAEELLSLYRTSLERTST